MSADETSPDGGGRAGGSWAKVLPALVVLLVLVSAASFLLFRGHGARTSLPGGARAVPARDGLLGTLTLPTRPAPAIVLRNYLGAPVTLARYRGKAVLVTFLYTNCPDVCPLITANLRVALNQLGARASRAEVIAVSVDPRGDTRAAVARFLRAHQMTGRMQYLVGSPAELARTWSAWSVGSSREVGRPGLVAHSALVYGVDAAGRLRTIYPSSFEPSELAHDVLKLSGE